MKKQTKNLLMIGGSAVVAYLIYKAMTKPKDEPESVSFANASGVRQTIFEGGIPNPTNTSLTPRPTLSGNTFTNVGASESCMRKLNIQLACISGGSSNAWYMGIKTPQDLERFKSDFLTNCNNGTRSTMFPFDFCNLSSSRMANTSKVVPFKTTKKGFANNC